jgi:aryl-alcohol dehydrogenase-like predicted oxidoreductase
MNVNTIRTQRPLGTTGLVVTPLGFGAGHIGGTNLTEQEVGTILNRAVDLGLNLVDTARGYGLSEERIGRHLSWRRKDVILVSKCGYSIPDVEDWTPQAIYEGVALALRLMQTDYLDVMMFHSCPAATLKRDGVIQALERCVSNGMVRFMGYSGENEDLGYAISTGRFQVIETSVNIFDQRGISTHIAEAARRGMGVIAKRPLANVAWKHAERPVGAYCEPYWERMKAMQIDTTIKQSGLTWEQVALRFAAYTPSVSTAIIGTGNIDNLHHNVNIIHEGTLPAELIQDLSEVFQKHDADWVGQV